MSERRKRKLIAQVKSPKTYTSNTKSRSCTVRYTSPFEHPAYQHSTPHSTQVHVTVFAEFFEGWLMQIRLVIVSTITRDKS